MANTARRPEVPVRPVPPTTNHLWTCADVAAFTQLSLGTIHNMSSRGELPPAIRIGRSLRWDPAVIIAWLHSLTEQVAA